MTGKPKTINPDLDEGTFDERASKAFDVRADIRSIIENPDGSVNPKRLREVAERNFMSPVTVERFAYGQTKKPSSFTLKRMALESAALRREEKGSVVSVEDDLVLALVPRDTKGIIIVE